MITKASRKNLVRSICKQAEDEQIRKAMLRMQVVFTNQGVKQSVLLTRKDKTCLSADLRNLADQIDDSNGRVVKIYLTHDEGGGMELTIETRVMENEPRTKTVN